MAAATAAITQIAASDVPVASRSPRANHSTSRGTITVPPPTPNSPLKTPAAVPTIASFSVRARGMRAILDAVSPALTLPEALATITADPVHSGVLLDVDGTLAPIVRHADDAQVPEATRTLLIAIAKRYGLVACVSGRRAATARRIVSIGSIAYIGNHGGEVLMPGARTATLDPDVATWTETIREFARVGMERRAPDASACGSRTRRRSSRSTGAAPPTTTRRPQPSVPSRNAPSARDSRPTGGERSWRSARRSRSTRAGRSPASCATPG